ncbi:transmembrane amino acid transporter protein-domain-containing protein [Ilyonectria sp. MPI-CAGE-AT-0026]|nr:transmembrane amino acid transporter protein-domain-containing protein [Ilyonectria sp. MPI-CAGE-AT-0026]
MSRRDAIFVLLTNQVGLGVLSLPGVLKTLGLVPGTVTIIGLGCLSWYTAFQLKLFYDRHPHVLNIVDMARIVGGRGFACVTAFGMLLLVVMTAASASVTFSVALSLLSDDALGSTAFIGIGCICCWILCVPRTARFVSQSGIPSCISILAATIVVIAALGAGKPVNAPAEWRRAPVWFANPSFRDGLNACLKICYAFSGNVSFVSYMAEMTNPQRDFNAALAWLEASSIGFYVFVAVSIYCLAGEYTTSPALGSAPGTLAQIAYGLVIPSVLSKGLAFGHTGIKFVYVEVMKHYASPRQFWTLSFVLSIAIPVFDSIVSMTSAVTIAWFSFGISAIVSLHMNVKFCSWQNASLTLFNSLLIIGSLFLNGAGLWSSTTELNDALVSRGDDVG